MTDEELEAACANAPANLCPDAARAQKRLDAIVNYLVGQVLKVERRADPKGVRAAVLRMLERGDS